MKIVLLNLLDSMMSGAAAFIFFQTILGKKKSQLPYYIILLIFVCSFTIYAAITSILIGNTSTLAVYLRLTLSSLLCFCLSFLYSANLRTKILISISTTILCSIFEAFSYYIITSIYSYRVEKDTMDFLVFSNISLMANMFFLIFSILIHFIWKKEAFVHSLSYTIILLVIPVLSVPVTIKTNFISKYKYSVCLFHFSSLCIVYKYYELYIVLQRPRKRRAPLSAYHPKRTD